MLTLFKTKIKPLFTQAQGLLKIQQATCPQFLIASNQQLISTRSYLHTQNHHCFSTFFDEMDNTDVQAYSSKKYQNKKYRALINLWKRPLQKKKRRQERIKQIKQALPQPVLQGEKLIVHNGAVGIQYPPGKGEIFCVVKVDGFQYKVTEDCVLILDTKEDHQINKKIKFEEVLIAGTSSYTLLGRPFLARTFAEGMIESISDSQKTLVFKKKRRKQYKKSFGSRVSLTSVRITKIYHEISSQTMNSAVSLSQTLPAQQKVESSERS